jgi:hypothetical protein
MFGNVINRSTLPDDEASTAIARAMGDMHLPGVLIELCDAPENAKTLGLARRAMSDEDEKDDVVVVRVPPEGYTSERCPAKTRSEWIVWLAAHEFAHIEAFREGSDRSEHDCDRLADDALIFHREVEATS